MFNNLFSDIIIFKKYFFGTEVRKQVIVCNRIIKHFVTFSGSLIKGYYGKTVLM